MNPADVIRALGPIDAKSIRRDSLLRWMFLMPILLALLCRWGVPPIARWMMERFQIDLALYHPLIVSLVVMVTPMMYGTAVGFLLLDQTDDRTLTALQVTPLTVNGYLAYRLGVPALLSVLLSVIAVSLTGLSAMGPGRRLVAAVAAAPLAPAIAWFVRSDWQWAFGICPTYWPAKVTWKLEAGGRGAWPT